MKTLLKSAAAVSIMVLCLITLVMIIGRTDSGRRIHKTIFLENAADWRGCVLENAVPDNESNSVVFSTSDNNSLLITPVINPGFRFYDLMLSWNVEKMPVGCFLNFEAAVSPDSDRWYEFQYLAYGSADSSIYDKMIGLPETINNIGRVATDILKLTEPMKYARIIIKAAMQDDSAKITLRRISVCFASDRSTWSDYNRFEIEKSRSKIGSVKLSVPYYTQRSLPSDLSGNCCSPTSVSMVLNYHERNIVPEDFCRSVYDPYHDMFGNWPYNMQAAYIAGMGKTWVEIHSSLDELYDEILEGKPVVISIAYGYDELPNSPIHEASVGHLVAVVGFSGPDTVICNDPAGHNPGDGIVPYPREELERVWLAHGGVAYHLWP